MSGKGAGVDFKGDIRAHTARVLDLMEESLKSAGSSMDKVLKVTVYLTDMKDYDGMNETYLGRFGPEPPVRTTVAVTAIPDGHWWRWTASRRSDDLISSSGSGPVPVAVRYTSAHMRLGADESAIVLSLLAFVLVHAAGAATAQPITAAGQPAQLDVRVAGERSIRVTLKPVSFKDDFPDNPALAERTYPPPALSLREVARPLRRKVGKPHRRGAARAR